MSQPKNPIAHARAGGRGAIVTLLDEGGGKLMAKQRRFAYVSLVPILLYLGLFTLFPIVWAVVMSFFSYTPIREGSGFLGLGGANPFVAIENYIELFTGTSKPAEAFRLAVRNTTGSSGWVNTCCHKACSYAT
jgi:ABC-type sugar transport system permease subunit